MKKIVKLCFLLLLILPLLAYYHLYSTRKYVIDDVTIPIKFESKLWFKGIFVDGIEYRIKGNITGRAMLELSEFETIFLNDGEVDFITSGEYYSKEVKIEFTPVDTIDGNLKIEVRRNGFFRP